MYLYLILVSKSRNFVGLWTKIILKILNDEKKIIGLNLFLLIVIQIFVVKIFSFFLFIIFLAVSFTSSFL